jgi:tetratricopeptide (TPR) repeat protein
VICRVARLALALGALVLATPAEPQLDPANQANLRGARLRENGDLAGAAREFSEVIRLAPENPEGWYNRGLVRRDQGDCRAALADFDKAIALAPDGFATLYHRGNCKQALGNFHGAIADYTRAIELRGQIPGRFLAHLARGDAYRRMAQPELAVDDYTRVTEMRTDTAVLRSRAWTNFYLARWQSAYRDAEKFLHDGQAKERGSAHLIALGALALLRSGQSEAARKFLVDWGARIKLVDWPAPVLRFLGGEINQDALRAAARGTGEQTEAQAYIGASLLASGQREAAVASLRWVLRNGEPGYWEYDLAYYELRRLDLARPVERRVPK